jgi:hypothetical protein
MSKEEEPMQRLSRIALVTTSIVVLVATAFPAAAHHRPTAACSPSGDVCKSTTKVSGVRRLRIGLAAKFFSRYRLCVTAPDDTETCHTYRIRHMGPVFGSSIRWSTHFPRKGPGPYDVVWRFVGGGRIGRVLGFHVRA